MREERSATGLAAWQRSECRGHDAAISKDDASNKQYPAISSVAGKREKRCFSEVRGKQRGEHGDARNIPFAD